MSKFMRIYLKTSSVEKNNLEVLNFLKPNREGEINREVLFIAFCVLQPVKERSERVGPKNVLLRDSLG
jgi:hypothetical protein